jgi:hypothetical protein
VQVMVHQSNLKHSMVRSLQQEAGPDGSVEVTAVTTAEGLQQAAYEGARHIEIREHLDLTTIDPAIDDRFSDVLTILSVSNSTWSIRVRLVFPCCVWKIGRLGFPGLCCILLALVTYTEYIATKPIFRIHTYAFISLRRNIRSIRSANLIHVAACMNAGKLQLGAVCCGSGPLWIQ